MSQVVTVDVSQTAIFTPRDFRDPLGVWGARIGLTGDATGGFIKVQVNVPAERKSQFVYTCYSTNITILTGTGQNGQGIRVRRLTNWPNIDPQVGVQGYGSAVFGAINTDADFDDPIGGMSGTTPNGMLFDNPNDRFMLLYDPRPIGVDMTIVEFELAFNTDLETYACECYGYYWDRAVMDVPGGPRHPGSN